MDENGWAISERDYRIQTPATRLRQAARAVVLEAGGIAQGLAGLSRRARNSPRVQVIYLHHVFDDEREAFRLHFQRLQTEYTFIPYSECVHRCLKGNIDRVYAAVSFDDGLASQLTGAKILQELGISACFFVCPAMIGETSRERLTWWCHQQLRRPLTCPLSWDELEQMLKMGHEIGSHTHTHVDLGKVTGQVAADELGAAYTTLRARLGAASCRHFSWPFGLFHNMTAEAAARVFGTGHESCASAIRGAHGQEAQGRARPCFRRDLLIPKWSVRQMSALLVRNMERFASGWPKEWEPLVGSTA